MPLNLLSKMDEPIWIDIQWNPNKDGGDWEKVIAYNKDLKRIENLRTADIFKKKYEPAKAKTNTNNMMNLTIPGMRSGSNTSKKSGKSSKSSKSVRGSSKAKSSSRVKSAAPKNNLVTSNSGSKNSKNGSSGRPPTHKKTNSMAATMTTLNK